MGNKARMWRSLKRKGCMRSEIGIEGEGGIRKKAKEHFEG